MIDISLLLLSLHEDVSHENVLLTGGHYVFCILIESSWQETTKDFDKEHTLVWERLAGSDHKKLKFRETGLPNDWIAGV